MVLCYEFTRPFFYKKSPRSLEEAKIDIFSLAIWFGEELFTYIRVFGSIKALHVLPYYVRITYWQERFPTKHWGDGITKTLKEQNKSISPTFPLQCGAFMLHDFGHMKKEIQNITSLNLATMSSKQYDPNKVAKHFIALVKIRQFIHEDDEFDYLFE